MGVGQPATSGMLARLRASLNDPRLGLALSPLPLPLEGYGISMAWHRRTATDPAQLWLRDLVRKIMRDRAPDHASR